MSRNALTSPVWKKQKAPRKAPLHRLIPLEETGAGEAIRTLDPNLGKPQITPFKWFIAVRWISRKCAPEGESLVVESLALTNPDGLW
ncbi:MULTISPECIES: hypothetical protein [unclassified Mesorhizobium]|uniref:hypothetical protein n=1 Tax=unclassified Mesorhizobium TaxID=325217 RepID=UPI0033376416